MESGGQLKRRGMTLIRHFVYCYPGDNVKTLLEGNVYVIFSFSDSCRLSYRHNVGL